MPEVPGPAGFRYLPREVTPADVLAGVTTRAFGDLRLGADASGGSSSPPDDVPSLVARPGLLQRWEELRLELDRSAGARGLVLSRQVHGGAVRAHRTPMEGLLLTPDSDGHVALVPGVALAVTLADCVPVFLLPDDTPAVGLLHAGWRGTAAGILENGLQALQGRTGVGPGRIRVHLGPSIGGPSYEVTAQVLRSVLPDTDLASLPAPDLSGSHAPAQPRVHLDLRAALAIRALAAGVPTHRITLSPADTRTDEGLYSHRGGDRGRHVAFVCRMAGARRPTAPGTPG